MLEKEIYKNEWNNFFDSFTKQHRDWLVSIEIKDDGNPKVLGRSLPLKGISLDGKDGEIVLILSNEKDEHLEHFVNNPENIYLKQTNEGADKELIIKSYDRVTTTLRFMVTALPEAVDGILTY